MKRVLCILSSMNAGGAETFLMKLYRRLDRNNYQMDFCINAKEKCIYEDEIQTLGGNIYRIPSKSENWKEFSKQLDRLVRTHNYQYVLRITSNALGFWDLKVAKRAGAKVCAARSSNSSDGAGWKSWVAHRMGKLLYGKYVDVKFAPSDLAARYTFGKKAYNKGKVTILPNALDLSVFRYDPQGRSIVRKEFGVDDDTLLVGHVGRFMEQKNHAFLLKVFQQILEIKPNSKLLLVGNGELEPSIRDLVLELDMSDNVIFAGVRSDVPQVMSAMDVFVFPSLYEGMPNTVIEAQATGLPCVIADTITSQANITGLVQYASLENTANAWAERAINLIGSRQDTTKKMVAAGYDITSQVGRFVKLVFGE